MKIQLGNQNVWVNYHHLYCFYIIASEGGLTAASKKLGIGQSALSIQMKQFESQLSTNLFERSHRRMEVSESGKLVLSYAKEIFRLGGEMVESLNDRPTPNRTHLQIAALDTIPKHLTVRLAQAALQPGDCSLSIVEGKSSDLVRDLLEHRADLMITNQIPAAPAGQLYSRRIARLPLWIVGAKSYLKLKKGFPRSLDGQSFVVPTSDSSVRHDLESFCRHHRIQPDFVAETQDVMVQKLLAVQAVGMTVVPEFAVQEYFDRKELHRIGPVGDAHEDLYLVSATRKIDNPVAARLMAKFRIRDSDAAV